MPSGRRRLCRCLGATAEPEHRTAALLAARNAKEFDGNANNTTEDKVEWIEKMMTSGSDKVCIASILVVAW